MNEKRLWRLRHVEAGLNTFECTFCKRKFYVPHGVHTIKCPCGITGYTSRQPEAGLSRKEWYDIMFAANPWYYELQKQKRKEVRKEMAIDYGREWKKLKGKHGLCRINVKGKQVHLKQVMDNQIDDTIANRERLMYEYINEKMTTDITGANEKYHFVKIDTRWGTFGTVAILKKDFDTWCKNKEKGGNVNAKH